MSLSLSLFFLKKKNYYHFVMSCAFKKTRPERASRVHIVSACAANIHGLAVDGQRRQLKKKKKKKASVEKTFWFLEE